MQETRGCKKCGETFSYERSRSNGRPRLFCSEICRTARVAELNAGYRSDGRYRSRAHTAREPKYERTCETCQLPFRTVNPVTKCCSRRCGWLLAQRTAHLTRSVNAAARRARVCEHCKGPFIMRNPSGAARAGKSREGRFCSRACVTEHRSNSGASSEVAAISCVEV